MQILHIFLTKQNFTSNIFVMKKRLLDIIKYLNMSTRSFEAECSLQRGNISNMSEDSAIGSDKLSKIHARFPEINLEWLITGQGSMLKNKDSSVISEPQAQCGRQNNETQYLKKQITEQKKELDNKQKIIENQQKIIDSQLKTIDEQNEQIRAYRTGRIVNTDGANTHAPKRGAG